MFSNINYPGFGAIGMDKVMASAQITTAWLCHCSMEAFGRSVGDLAAVDVIEQ